MQDIECFERLSHVLIVLLDIITKANETIPIWYFLQYANLWAYGVVVSMFDFHRSDRGSNPGRGGKIS